MSQALFSSLGDNLWQPDPCAQGPFAGLQGGAVAGLMASQVEGFILERSLGRLGAVTTHFLKPAPMSALRVEVQPLRLGRRVSVIDVSLKSSDEVVAIQRATVLSGISDCVVPVPPDAPAPDIARMPRRDHDVIRKNLWLWSAMDVREADDGGIWFRLPCPITAQLARLSAALPAADFAHGARPPLGASTRPAISIPNPELTAHFWREPEGDWVGVKPALAMDPSGLAAGWSGLRDQRGYFGRVAMSVATIPL